MSLEAVLARVQGVRGNGSGWMALCPAHKDRSPSLSVREGRDGRVLVHCFAGCTVEAICAAIGIRVVDLFAGPGAARKPKPPIVSTVEKQLIGLRSRLSPRERERPITIVLAKRENPDVAIAHALALSVEGELVQVAMAEAEQ